MVSIFTKARWIASVIAGFTLAAAVTTIQAEPHANLQPTAARGDALIPFAQALARHRNQTAQSATTKKATTPSSSSSSAFAASSASASGKRRASASLPAASLAGDGDWVNLAEDKDGTVNISEIAKELEHAVKQHAQDDPGKAEKLQHFSRAEVSKSTVSDAPSLVLGLGDDTPGSGSVGLDTTPKPRGLVGNAAAHPGVASAPASAEAAMTTTTTTTTTTNNDTTVGTSTNADVNPDANAVLPQTPIQNQKKPPRPLPPALQAVQQQQPQQQPSQQSQPLQPQQQQWQHAPQLLEQQDERNNETQAEAVARIKAESEKAERDYIEAMRERAYRQTELEAFPMNPQHIIKLRQKLDETQRAQEVYPGTPPEPVSTSLIVNLSPGTTPPVVRLGLGFVSSLVFVDATGAPWQILSYDVGAPDIFNIQWDKDSNMLLIQPLRPYTYGNIAVSLKGLNTPVMLTLVPGQKVIDYRVDMRIQALGPNPNEDLLGDGLPANANSLLLNFLNGAAPDSAKPLMVHGSYTQAWVFRNKLYVRSRFKVISPSWLSSMASADGTHVYELPKAPVLLLSRHGKIVSMQLEGF